MAEMKSHEFDVMARVEDGHWWYRALRSLVVAALEDGGFDPKSLLVDVGCGTGGTLKAVRKRYPAVRYIGVDVNDKALDFTSRLSPSSLIRASADRLPPLEEGAGAIVCLDVLYFSSISPEAALQGFFEALKPGGILVLNLPAFKALAGKHDRAVGITRRFRLGEACGLVEGAGFEVVRATYWNTTLFLPMLAWRIFSRLLPSEGPSSDLEITPGALNAGFDALMRVEIALARMTRLPFGSSAFVVARKPRTSRPALQAVRRAQ